MKVWQVLALSALVLFTTIGAHADGASTGDARIIVGSGGDPVGCGLPDFLIKVNGSNGGFIDCLNTSGQDWVGLEIIGIAKKGNINFGPDDVLCNGTASDPSNLFSRCNMMVTQIKNNEEIVTIILSGGEITSGEAFFINLNNDPKKNGKGGTKGSWIGGLKLKGSLEAIPVLAPVPEPGTMPLLLAGWGGLWFWRKQHSSKPNA